MASKIGAIASLGAAVCVLCALYVLPVSAQSNPQGKPRDGDTAEGKRVFERHCAVCHGIEGKGGRGPGLNRARLLHAPDDAALASVIGGGIPPEMPEAWFLDEQEIADVAAFVRSLGKIPPDPLPGDPARGAAVFARSGCVNCHILAGQGFGYGPDLSDIGERRSVAHLRQAISRPETALPEGFLLVQATTASGEVVEGIRLNEDTFTLQLKDAKGQFRSLRKQDLKELRRLRGKTPMPSYEAMLDKAALDDLVAYLASQRGAP